MASLITWRQAPLYTGRVDQPKPIHDVPCVVLQVLLAWVLLLAGSGCLLAILAHQRSRHLLVVGPDPYNRLRHQGNLAGHGNGSDVPTKGGFC